MTSAKVFAVRETLVELGKVQLLDACYSYKYIMSSYVNDPMSPVKLGASSSFTLAKACQL